MRAKHLFMKGNHYEKQAEYALCERDESCGVTFWSAVGIPLTLNHAI